MKWNTDWRFVCWEILNISPSSHSLYNNTTNINKWCHSHPFNCALSIIHCRNTEAAYKHGCAATVSTHGLQLYSHWWKKRGAHRGGKMGLLQDEQKERAVPFSQLNERTRWQKKEAWTAFLISIPKCLSGGGADSNEWKWESKIELRDKKDLYKVNKEQGGVRTLWCWEKFCDNIT